MSDVTTRFATADDAETVYNFLCELEDFKRNHNPLFHQQFQKNLADFDKIVKSYILIIYYILLLNK